MLLSSFFVQVGQNNQENQVLNQSLFFATKSLACCPSGHKG